MCYIGEFFKLCKGTGDIYKALKSNSKWYLNLSLSYITSNNVTICDQYAKMISLAKCWQNTGEKNHKISYKVHFKVTDNFAKNFA